MPTRLTILHRTAALAYLALACGGERGGDGTPRAAGSRVTASYSEPQRPQFHFSPAIGWMNDPNGLVYHAGVYHLFYQYYPDSTVWGPMHWGHATSRDLVHWEHLPIALRPDSLGYIFSGSAVFDSANTSGLGAPGSAPLVAMFTYHDMAAEKAGRHQTQSQALAFSTDSGRTWSKHASNPVIPNPGGIRDFRDPKLVRDEARDQWVVALAVGDHTEFWRSKDLKAWSKLSEFGRNVGNHGGVWECPDFFPMTVEGTSEVRWVLVQSLNPGHPNGGSGTQYFVGTFDGRTFTLDQRFAKEISGGRAAWLDLGRDNYAGVTWSNEADGRLVLIGWMSNWQYATRVPTTSWRSAMTIPRALTLRETTDGYRLVSAPVPELASLRSVTFEEPAGELSGTRDVLAQVLRAPLLLEIELAFTPPAGSSARVGIEVANEKGERYRVGYDAGARIYFSDRTRAGDAGFAPEFAPRVSSAPRVSRDGTVRLRLYLDVASAELFADGGLVTMTEVFFPSAPFSKLRLFSDGGSVQVAQATVHRLKSTWEQR